MRSLSLLFITLLFMTSASAQHAAPAPTSDQSGKVNWMTWNEMVKAMESEPKPIFIDTYTAWCGWCKVMDRNTFSHPQIADYMNQNYYAVKMDAEMKDTITFRGHTFVNPNPTGKRSPHQLASSLLENRMSYPSFIFLNTDFVRLNILPGYKAPKDFEPYIHYYAEGVNQGVTFEEFKKEFAPAITQ